MAFQSDSIFWVEVEKIVPNPYQPRREFNQESLGELAESIRMYGVLQPLTVTRKEIRSEDGSFRTEYELIAGERRLRASRLAEISLVPVIIREGHDNEQEKLELAIIENLQREDLNAVDRALAFKQLADSFSLTATQVAKKVGRSREYVANTMRLLDLPESILDGLREGKLAEGHARTLLMLNDKPQEQDTVFREILLKKLSVREVERISRSIATDKIRKKDKYYDPELIELEKKFTETLGTRVQIQKTDFGGKVTIDYFSPEDLNYMLERMKEDARAEADGQRRPFSPPKNTNTAQGESMQQLEDATPLSALIAQLEEVEGVTKEVEKQEDEEFNIASSVEYAFEENKPADKVDTNEPAVTAETASDIVDDANTPSAPTQQMPNKGSSDVQSDTGETVYLPQIAKVASEFTTAVYVRDPNTVSSDNNNESKSQAESETITENPDPVDKDNTKLDNEEDLYSVRNFTI